MNCPLCAQPSIVLKTLGNERRRRCTICRHLFTTVEKLKEDERRQVAAIEAVRQAAAKISELDGRDMARGEPQLHLEQPRKRRGTR
jgi:transcriptional regulator NrdR family protein